MGRFSPSVLPEAFDFGGILDRIEQGYYRGRGLSEDRRRREREERLDRERQADRSRYLRALRAHDLSQPGASTLSDYLPEAFEAAAAKPVELSERAQPRFRGREMATLRESPQAEARFREEAVAGPLTEETLRRVSQASETDVPIEFKEPEPRQVRLPSGRTAMLRDRAPYLSESGVVMDPQRAREERSLAGFLDQQMQGPQPWEAKTRQEQLDFAREKAEAGRRPIEEEERLRRAGRTTRQPMTYSEASRDLYARYGEMDEEGFLHLPPWVTLEWRQQAMDAIRAGEEPPPLPPPPTARPITAGPPKVPVTERIGGFFGGIGRGFRRTAGEPDEFRQADEQRAVEAPVAQAPRTAAAPSEPAKRTITQDQADYLRSIGKWDPSKYEVR